MPVKISPSAFEDFARDIFVAKGLSPEDSAALAHSFVWASLRGIDSHGIARVPRYVEMFENGIANPAATITVDDTRPGTAVVDADFAPGPIALTRAAELAVEKAKTQGVAIVSVRNTVHTGAIGYYPSLIAEQGLVGIGIAAGSPMMSYTGAVGASVATSPLAIGVPAGEGRPTVLLDMATSLIAMGKIAQAKRTGTPLPEGSATTADGTPTTDPELAKVPTPLGGAKGSGLSLMFELITSVLVTAPILTPYHAGTKKHRQNATLIVVDPAAFGDVTDFVANVDATVDTIHDLPKAEGVDAILVPGERSSAAATARAEAGIPVGDKLWTELVEVAGALGVTLPEAA
ncbi:Ldh family oxidoreductase [Microbacterium thalassium]|uniref:Ureidoglycolate dehydrogenase (NAD+) n=1 Tax=Microbacterium thalassium TaxID=362649 RepID=A0A7X0KTD5_9MICO|nr:Ldh family oxidoreductase [Microbacterium thalassium]MBB6389943.1 ureidoglycolate dehydrogenase (NAD+) [Microbacterium thalassium]GLK24629.1 dehydrogenase [Microbacterium thalassium]